MSLYTLQNIPPRSLIMSDESIAAMPMWAQAIIMHQRALEALCSLPVVAFEKAKDAFERRRFLARAAHKQWVNADLPPTR